MVFELCLAIWCSVVLVLLVGLTAIGGLVRTSERASLGSSHEPFLILSAKLQVCHYILWLAILISVFISLYGACVVFYYL